VRIDYNHGIETFLQVLIDAKMCEAELLATDSVSSVKNRCWAPKSINDLRSHCFKLRLEEQAIWTKGQKVGVMAQVVDKDMVQEILGNEIVD
jgi:hypothetical protein